MTELNYRTSGDYLIPDLTLTEQEQKPLGKYGRMRKKYLQEHRPVLWNQMILSETLYPHLREIDEQAQSTVDTIIARMAEVDGVTEELKTTDPMCWIGLMNNYRHCAEEFVLRDVVYI